MVEAVTITVIAATATAAADAFGVIDKIAGRIEKKFAEINRQLGEMFERIGAIGRKMTEMGIEGVAGVAGMLAYGLKFSDELDTMSARMAPLVGGLERAEELTLNLAKLSTEGPFGIADITNLGRSLAGVDKHFRQWDNMKKAVLLYEDLAAVLSSETGMGLGESLREVTDNLNQFIESGGRDKGDLKDLLPMGTTPEGVDVWDLIGEEAAAGGAGAFIASIKKRMPEAWRNAAESMDETLSGKWSNLVDKFNIGLKGALSPLHEKLMDFIDKLTEMGAVDILVDIFGEIAGFLAEALEYIGPFILKFLKFVKENETVKKILAYAILLGPPLLIVGGIILQIVGALGGIATGIAGFLGALGTVATVIAIIAAVVVAFWPVFVAILIAIAPILVGIGVIIMAIINMVVSLVTALIAAYIGFKNMSDKSRERLERLAGFIRFLGFLIKYVFKAAADYVKPVIQGISNFFAKAFGLMADAVIWTFEQIMKAVWWTLKALDDLSEAMGGDRTFEHIINEWQVLEKQRELRSREWHPLATVVGGAARAKGGAGGGLFGDLSPEDLAFAPAGGGGGGGGGGTGGAGRAITLYQTFERDSVKITTTSLDAEGFTDLMGTVAKKEADTL